MEKMDLMSLNAGVVIYYNGMPLILPYPIQVLGNHKNFFKEGKDFYFPGGSIPDAVESAG